MDERRRRQTREFADIVPGQTTEVYLDLTERREEAQHADARQPALIMLHGDLPGRVFRLHTGRQLIGRRGDCEIRLREKAVSAHHAEVVSTDAGVSVSDLASTNGTVVNGRRITKAVFLAQGNLLKLGTSVFKYVESLVEVELSESLYVRNTIDPVTGLSNRAAFLLRLAYMVDSSSPAAPVSVIVFDLEDFAAFVDARGRAGADDLLRHIGMLLQQTFAQESNAIARLGDESFAVALGGTPLAAASSAARAAGVDIEGAGVKASIGVASTERPTETAEGVLSAAEQSAARARRA